MLIEDIFANRSKYGYDPLTACSRWMMLLYNSLSRWWSGFHFVSIMISWTQEMTISVEDELPYMTDALAGKSIYKIKYGQSHMRE